MNLHDVLSSVFCILAGVFVIVGLVFLSMSINNQTNLWISEGLIVMSLFCFVTWSFLNPYDLKEEQE